MMLTMYALKDELNGFTSPIPFANEDIAKRYLKEQAMENPTIRNSAKDFSIWQIGFYDSDTAKFDQIENKLIERADNYVK